jgi:peptidoglycan/LPS O-acetylase OafA/YrhL
VVQPTPENAKIHALHGLRGVMAWWVVFGHISLAFNWQIPLIDRNTLAVDVFVLLSGFVIAMLIDRKREPYGTYIVRRAFRLFPLYLIVLGISAALLPIQIGAWASLEGTAPNLNRVKLAWDGWQHLTSHMITHIPLAQGLVPKAISSQAPYTIVGQAWSISLEWQFYLIAPLLMWTLAKTRRMTLALVTVIVLIILSHWFTGAFIGAKIIHFAIGIVTFKLLKREDVPVWGLVSIALTIAAIAKNGAIQVIPLGIWAAVIWSSSRPAHSAGHSFARLFGGSTLFKMGEISYSVYLIHMIPLYASIYFLRDAKLPQDAMQIIVMLITIVTTYLISCVTFRYIEQPCIRFGASVTMQRRA